MVFYEASLAVTYPANHNASVQSENVWETFARPFEQYSTDKESIAKRCTASVRWIRNELLHFLSGLRAIARRLTVVSASSTNRSKVDNVIDRVVRRTNYRRLRKCENSIKYNASVAERSIASD